MNKLSIALCSFFLALCFSGNAGATVWSLDVTLVDVDPNLAPMDHLAGWFNVENDQVTDWNLAVTSISYPNVGGYLFTPTTSPFPELVCGTDFWECTAQLTTPTQIDFSSAVGGGLSSHVHIYAISLALAAPLTGASVEILPTSYFLAGVPFIAHTQPGSRLFADPIAVPEPSAPFCLMLGIAGLIVFRYRKRIKRGIATVGLGAVLMGLGGTAGAEVWMVDIGLENPDIGLVDRATGQFDEADGAIVSWDILSFVGSEGPIHLASSQCAFTLQCDAVFLAPTHIVFTTVTDVNCHYSNSCFSQFVLMLDGPLTGDSVGVLPTSRFTHALTSGFAVPGSRIYDAPHVPEPGMFAWMLLAIPFLWIFWKRQVFAAGRP